MPYPIRHNWSREEISSIYHSPLLDLIFEAASVHRKFHASREIQLCTLLSIKTGGCPENCSYCPQSARYNTDVKAEALMQLEEVLDAAKNAKNAGSTRFCMGAAWRQVRNSPDFERVLVMVREVSQLGLEVCCCLGMLTEEQAKKLKEAGLHSYNHNVDSGEEFYPSIITSRTYQDRLNTLENVRKADLSVCCGGIIGLGEKSEDRISMLHTLATLPTHPDSVPINMLVSVKGTPLQNQAPIPVWEMLRMVATARLIMPQSMVRLSAGRLSLSDAEQALCFMAGANSIFTGDKLLTTPNPDFDRDQIMLKTLGLVSKPAEKSEEEETCECTTHA
ncbi:biotin synthase BioB [Parachlamydia acanthamoebae]|uniref:Biotin synthase n=2 Tax=Parachlamydia acanthamoebae TaxID=83552 RepID=F8L018_PARAV|nr:biotin synthase BioB [Parachlamydia acanthamoebae]CCB86533.1 biotin synthase [Parachlamydia acanthamoebae UV-7]